MKEFSELIKNIDILRRLIREFFVFGYKSRTDFDQKSSKTYDNDKRRIQNYFEEYFYGIKDKYGKRNSILVDSDSVGSNPLFRLYKSKSFTTKDLILHFLIIDAFRDLKEATVKEFADYISDEYDVSDIDSGTVRIKLNEYVELGILKSYERNNKIFYSLSEFDAHDIFDSEFLSFFSEVAPLGVIGSFIKDRIPSQQEESIKYKHRLLYAALDSYYLVRLLEAMERRETLRVAMKTEGRDKVKKLIPLKILINKQNGREYVACYDVKWQNYTNCRLDLIVEIASLATGYDEQEYKSMQSFVAERLKHTWCVNYYLHDHPQKVELVLYIGDNEEFIFNRLQREGHGGKIEHIGGCRYQYSNAVYDPSEMIPFIKSFIGRIVSVWIEDETWNERLHKDIFSLL